MFAQMFSGGNPFFGQGFRQPQQPRNRTLNIQTTISLEDAFSGKELVANIGLPSGREQTVQIKIPAGILDGTVLRLAGMGDDSVVNTTRGDIHLAVNIAPHNKFHRNGDDLVCDYEISCIDAMLGKVVYVNTIDGKTLEMSIPAGTQHGTVMSVNGYGMCKMNDNRFKGRLLINILVRIPTALTDQQKQTLADIFK
jgi:DnaJ-class molecular chaperone